VHAIKLDKALNGYFDIFIDGRHQRICKGQEDLAIAFAAEMFAGIIKNSAELGSTWTNVATTRAGRGFALASEAARRLVALGANAVAEPLLYWDRVMPRAKDQGGSRAPDVLQRHLCCSPTQRIGDRTIVLLDDVVTSGGHMLACERFLRTRNYVVADNALAVARTVHVKGVPFEGRTEALPRPDDRPSLDDDEAPPWDDDDPSF
jgi:adenine/guanine phosphoribosyltransferase-like PRPP-binding protein